MKESSGGGRLTGLLFLSVDDSSCADQSMVLVVGVGCGCGVWMLNSVSDYYFYVKFFCSHDFAGLTDVVVGFLVGCVGVCEDS